jgi:hypothetical protein
MKTILFALLFTSAITFAQEDLNAKYAAFTKEFEAYRDNPEVSSENSTIKPAPCGQYNLVYMITERDGKEIVSTPPAKKLCADLNRFDKSKNPNLGADWNYEIKPVGNRYYTIRANKNGADGVQEIYYYERKVK